MNYFVYLLVSFSIKNKVVSYVGYTNNLNKRLELHNKSKGAKFTKGKKWYLAYSKRYINRNIAMKEEYKLKKNSNMRKKIKDSFLKKFHN